MTQRSTKGASKQRRDAINEKISQIREQLPVSEAVRNRMSQLQVMALTNAYISKSNFFSDCFEIADPSTMLAELFDFTLTIPGFLLMANVDGRILYISDNVSDYLGNSSVDAMTQVESVYDLIDERDREILRQAMMLHQKTSSSSAFNGEPWMQAMHGAAADSLDGAAVRELSFTCRMNSAARSIRTASALTTTLRTNFDRQKTMQITGKFLKPRSLSFGGRSACNSNPHLMTVFVAHCTPHLVAGSGPTVSCIDVTETSEADTMTFRSVHKLDMSFLTIDANGEFHLSCDRKTIFGKSWYAMIHPEDIEEAKSKHMELTSAYQIGDMAASRALCMRVQIATGCNLWLNTVMRLHGSSSGSQDTASFHDTAAGRQAVIVCTSHVIDEMTALFLRIQQQLETPNEAVDSANRQLMSTIVQDEDIFGGAQFGLFSPVTQLQQPQTTVVRTACREENRMELNQRLKRKITDRQLEQAAAEAAVRQSKERRFDAAVFPAADVADPSAAWMQLSSMPSPPMQQWDYNVASAGSVVVGQSAFNCSTFGAGAPIECNAPISNFASFQDARGAMQSNNNGPVSIPDAYVTPSSSPALLNNQSADAFGLDDFVRSLPDDDYSFFSSCQPVQSFDGPLKASVVDKTDDGGCSWNSASLPELDACSVASILGDSELLTPTTAGATKISEFGLPTESRRQQLSGGHVTVVNGVGQSTALGRQGVVSKAVNHPQQLHLHQAVPQPENCRGNNVKVGNNPLDQQLIYDLLALGGNFLQNVSLPESSFNLCNAGAVFQPTNINSCIPTTVFDETFY